jgi:beta-mannosidase
MYEGRNAKLFNPSTAVITWMSNPAQPSFVWQLYHHDLEPNSALYAVQKSGEMVHIQLNEMNDSVEVINNRPDILSGATAYVSIYNLDGSEVAKRDMPVKGAGSTAIDLGSLLGPWDQPKLSAVNFVRLQLKDASGAVLSENFYWRGLAQHPDDLTALDSLKPVKLEAKATRGEGSRKDSFKITVTLHNPAKQIALMTHVQLRHGKDGERVLPVYASDNYVSLVPGESKTITIEADTAQLKGEAPALTVDGWNVSVGSAGSEVPVTTNVNAQVDHWPVTGLPIVAHTWK